MRAWQFMGPGKPISLNEIPDPVAGPDDVVIETKAAGLCHTDIGILQGPLAVLCAKCPQTLGHEIAGQIISVGENVKDFKVGDRVAAIMALDVPGIGSDGGYAEKVLIPARLAVKIPDGVTYAQAAAGSDAGATGYFGVHGAGHVKATEKVGIIGFGGVGSFGTRAAVLTGAEVYVAELKEELHEEALAMGVKACVKDARELAQFGCDVIIDYAGFGITTSIAVEVVNPHGRVVVVGMGKDETTINTTLLITKHLTFIGSGVEGTESVLAVYDLIGKGEIKPLITEIKFEEIGEGLERLEQGNLKGRLVAVMD